MAEGKELPNVFSMTCQTVNKRRRQKNPVDTLIWAPSTPIRIFLKTHLFYPFWVSVHTETAFSVIKNEAFRKRSSELIFLKTPFSRCRVDG